MFKIYFLTALLFLILSGSSIAEESQDTAEREEISPLIQCDKQHDICVEKCGDTSTEICLDKCAETADKCYDQHMSEMDDPPPAEDRESEPQN